MKSKPTGGALVALLVLVSCGDAPEPPPQSLPQATEKAWTPRIPGDEILERCKRLCALGPRVPGTPGIERARAELTLQFHEAGLPKVKRQAFVARTPDPKSKPQKNDTSDRSFKQKTRFVNLVVELPGRSRKGIGIAAHYDSKQLDGFEFVGANDSASGVASVIAIAEHFARIQKGAPRERSLYFILFDGEESIRHDWQEPDCTYGSRHFAEELATRKEKAPYPLEALVLLDMVGAPDLWLADDENSDPRLRRIFKETSREVFGTNMLDRAGRVNAILDDHIPFMRRGIPAIDLIDGPFAAGGSPPTWWHTAEDTIDRLSPRSLEKVCTLVIEAVPRIEAALPIRR